MGDLCQQTMAIGKSDISLDSHIAELLADHFFSAHGAPSADQVWRRELASAIVKHIDLNEPLLMMISHDWLIILTYFGQYLTFVIIIGQHYPS